MSAPIELLLAESAWLRRLLRRLAGDDDGAADLQQEVAVAALQARGPSIGAAWLVSVARRLSALRRRRALREAARLAGLVPRDSAPGAAEVVAETELQRRAVDAVLALPPHYRDVVLLRFMRGMPVDAVARQLGVGIDTVRTRQKRALRQLRAQLLPQQDLGARLGAPLAGIIMGMSKKLVAVAALVLAVLWSSLYWAEGNAPVTATEPASPVTVASGAALQGADAAAMPANVGPQSEERQMVPTAPVQPAPTPPPRRAPAVPTGNLLVTVVAVDGELAGEGHAVLCRAASGPGEVRASDGTSTVRFSDLPAGRYFVGTAHATKQTVDVLADSTATATIRLGAGKTVAGRVVDAQGRPVPFAEIRTQHGGAWPAWQFPIGRADAAGQFEVGGVTPMQMLLATDARLGATPGRLLREAELAQQPHAVVELKFSDHDRTEVRGRVVDAAGTPVFRAWVQLDPFAVPALEGRIRGGGVSTRLCTTDAEGRFVAAGIPVGSCRLYVYAHGLAPHTRYLRPSTGELLDVEVVLPRGATVRGVVRDELGQPIAGAYVNVDGQSYPQAFYRQTDAAGTFTFDDVAAGTFRVAAWQRQSPRIRREVVIDGPGEHTIEIVLTNEGSLRGRLLDARGQPLVNWFVQRRGGSRWTATDTEGRFVCVECKPAGNELLVRPKDQQLVHARFENLQPGPTEQVLVVDDDRLATAHVRGRVLDVGGQGIAGAQLQLEQFGALWSLPTHSGADGTFEVGPLPPGSYRLKLRRDGHRLPDVDFELRPHQELRMEPVYELR